MKIGSIDIAVSYPLAFDKRMKAPAIVVFPVPPLPLNIKSCFIVSTPLKLIYIFARIVIHSQAFHALKLSHRS